MSCHIRLYKLRDKRYGYSHDMLVTAVVGKQGNASIQFTIGDSFIILDEEALQDLVHTIEQRLQGNHGYTATGQEREDITYEKTNMHDR